MRIIITALGLVCSNCIMTYAWYGHLSSMKGKAWYLAALVSWGVAFFEYMIAVPANRYGSQTLTLPQLKIMQEAIALTVFIPVSIFVLKEKVTLDYFFAMLCILGAVFFIFRSRLFG